MKKTPKLLLPFIILSFLLGNVNAFAETAKQEKVPYIIPAGIVHKEVKDITNDDLMNAIRAGSKKYVDTRAKIVEMLTEVKRGQMDPEVFYKEVSKLDMPPGKEVRHTLMEVKKDIGNYLGENGLKAVFGTIYETGSTYAEAKILMHREKVVMETIKKAIVAYREKVKAATGEYPKFSFYYGEVGGWPKEKFIDRKFAGDIDFNFLSGDLDAAMEMKKIFDAMILERYGRTPEELDIPCTVHGMATSEVYVGKYGQSFAETVTKVAWEIDFENAGEGMELKAKEVPFKEVLQKMVLEARINKINNGLDDLQTSKWPTQPGISLEMIRHFEHDIAGKNVYTDLESFVKAAKYTERSYDFLVKELRGSSVKLDDRLRTFVTELTEYKKNPKKQVELIKEYFEDMGKPIPFDVNLEITADGKGRATIEANERFIKEFWDVCRKTMWDGANQVLRKKMRELKKKVKNLGQDDLEESKAIYEEVVKLDEMLEIEDRVLHDDIAGLHDHIDSEYTKNINEFREIRNRYKEKSAKFGHVEYIDPEIGKAYKWIETMLKMGKPSNIKWAAAAMFSAPGKFNDVLDFIDDGLMTKFRNGGGEEYIQILRKGQGLYWDEQVNQFLKGTPWEGRYTVKHTEMAYEVFIKNSYAQELRNISQSLNSQFEKILATRGLQMVRGAGGAALKGVQTVNNTFNESVSGSKVGGAMMTGMMIYSLKDELPLYYNYIGERDFGGLAAEFFKRRVPFGGAVEQGVMGNYYGVAWEITATILPPAGILSAAKSVGEYTAKTGIETIWTESLESFIDNLYEKAEFKIASVETVGDNIKISEWELLNVTYKGEKYNINDLIALETSDARAMAACLQKTSEEREECFTMDMPYNGLFEWFNAKDAFEHKFEKTDSWLQLIAEMAKDKNVGKKLKDHFRYQRYTRLEQIKVKFLKHLKQNFEERRAGEQALISGNFPKAYDELMKIADQLDIRLQLEKEMNGKFGGGVMQFMTSLKDMLRGVVRELRGDVDVWDVYEELSAFVTENLRTYKRILDGRSYAEEKLVLKKHDQGLRILTGPYFLTGIAAKDASFSEKWFQHIDQLTDKTIKTLTSIKVEAKADPTELDLNDETYDLGTLNRLVYHESFKDMWKQVNNRLAAGEIESYLGDASSSQTKPNVEGIISDQDRALMRFALHTERIKETIDEFRRHYELASKQGEEEKDGKDENSKEKESVVVGLEGLLNEITSVRDQIMPVSGKIKGLVERVKKISDHAAGQVEAIKSQLDAIASKDTAAVQSEPFDDSVLSESRDIEFLTKLVATLRTSIENETLISCQQYEKIKTGTKMYDLEHFMEEAKSSFKIVQEKYEEYSQIQHKLNPLKDRVQQTLGKLATAKTFVIDQAQLGEIESSLATLKDSLSSVPSLVNAIKDHNQHGSALNTQSASILEKLNDYDPVLIAEEQKQIPDKIRGVGSEISAVHQDILSVSSALNENPVDYNEEIAGLRGHLKALQKAAKTQKTVTRRSYGDSANALKDIIALIEAAQLFYPPIEESYKNIKICMDGSKRVYKEKTSPEAQLKMADCRPFEGTSAVWSDEEQTVRCDCPKGIDWDEKKKKCVDNSPEAQLARANCLPFKGTKAQWNQAEQVVDCNCSDGLEWSDQDNECVDNSPEGQIARLNCKKFPGTYAKWNAKENKPQCFCPDGWIWSKENNKCLDNSPEAQVARTKCKYLNSRAKWSEDRGIVVCSCITDYEWNSAQTACRLKKEIQVSESSCKQGLHPAWDNSREEVRCYCDNGSWDSSKERCISEYEQELARRERRREENDRQRRWDKEQHREQQQQEAERQRYCRESLERLNNSVLQKKELWEQYNNANSARNWGCPLDEIQAAEKGQWHSSGSLGSGSGSGSKGNSGIGSGSNSGGGTYDWGSGGDWDCSHFPGGVCPGHEGGGGGGLLGTPGY